MTASFGLFHLSILMNAKKKKKEEEEVVCHKSQTWKQPKSLKTDE